MAAAPTPAANGATATAPKYRIYRSAESLLIRFEDGREIELSDAEACQIAQDLAPRKVPAVRRRRYIRWTPELREQARRLYQDEGMGASEIAGKLGFSRYTVSSQIHSVMKLPPHNPKVEAAGRLGLATRRAAE